MKVFGIALVVAMTVLNVAGSSFVARVQTAIVFVVVGILALFAVVTIVNANFALLAPSTYPSVRQIISSVALTFFAFLGFGVVTFTARDLPDPSRQLPRAMGLAIGIATVIYVAVAIGVFGTLPVHEVVASGADGDRGRRRSRSSGNAGFWLMSVTALFATTGATNAGLYPAPGIGTTSAGPAVPAVHGPAARRTGVGEPADRRGRRRSWSSPVRPVGDRVARERRRAARVHDDHRRPPADPGEDRGERLDPRSSAVVTAVVSLATFVFTSLIDEPASIVMLGLIVVLSLVLDLVWGRGVTPVDGSRRGRLTATASTSRGRAAQPRARRQQPALVGGGDRRGPVVDVELRVDVEQVRLDRRLGDEQPGRRAAVRLALGDQASGPRARARSARPGAGARSWLTSRVATDGASTASPRAAARIARTSSSRGESFSR